MNKAFRRHGLTLLEIMLAMVILTVMVAIVATYITQPSGRVKREACNLRSQQLQLLARQYQADYGTLPRRDMRELSDTRYLGEAIPSCPVDNRSYALDRRSGQVIAHNHP